MSRVHIERRLIEVGDRLKGLRHDLAVAQEQLLHFSDDADESRLRSLVSETPVADREHRQARRHAEAMMRHRDELRGEIDKLEQLQDELLDRMISESSRSPT